MFFKTNKEALLKPLQTCNGVVERRQAMPVLANVLLATDRDGGLAMTATDLEVEIGARAGGDVGEAGEVTVPARKLLDIVRTLPDGGAVEMRTRDGSLEVRCGRSRFKLSTLPASEFPTAEGSGEVAELMVEEALLADLLTRTQFAMAQQDVRYYLNGMLLEVEGRVLRTVATDGHRLATAEVELGEALAGERLQIIVPRKAVVELGRVLSRERGEDVRLAVGQQALRAEVDDLRLTTKLVDGKFPEYEAVIPVPSRCSRHAVIDRETLRQSLSRVAILSNEKYRAVRLMFSESTLQVLAHNQEQEEAEEEIPVQLEGDTLEIGFNVTYMLDALAVIRTGEVRLDLGDSNASCLIRSAEDDGGRFVVMPMRL